MRLVHWLRSLLSGGRRRSTSARRYRDQFVAPLSVRRLEERRVLAAPTVVAFSVTPDTIDEGESVTASITSADADLSDTHTFTVDWGDGSTVSSQTLSPGDRTHSFTHTYADDPTNVQNRYTATLTVSDGSATDTATDTVTVENVDPVATIQLPTGQLAYIVEEGGTVQLTGSATDAGGAADPLTFAWDLDNDGDFDDATGATPTFSAVGRDGPTSQTIRLRVTDGDGGSDIATATVAIVNAAPTVGPLTLRDADGTTVTSINEQSAVTLTGSFTDPGTPDTHTVMVVWGDGSSSAATVDQSANTYTATHTYADDDPDDTNADLSQEKFSIVVTVTDDDHAATGSGRATGTTDITVRNVAPVFGTVALADASGAIVTHITEGQTVFLQGAYTEVSPLDELTLTINWGDGPAETYTPVDGVFRIEHTYGNNTPLGAFAVTVRLVDDDTGAAQISGVITVLNVAPTLPDPNTTNYEVNEGTPFSFLFTDPGILDSHVAVIDWGDDVTRDPFANPLTADAVLVAGGVQAFQHTYADDGIYTISVYSLVDVDGDGAVIDPVPTFYQVLVNNVAPTVDGSNITVPEGSTQQLANLFTITDPGFDNQANLQSEFQEIFFFRIDWGDGSGLGPLTASTVDVVGGPGALTEGSVNPTHSYADDGTFLVTVQLWDDNMLATGALPVQHSVTVTVENVAPALTVPAGIVVDEGTPLSAVLALLSDPGYNNPNNPDGAGGPTTETFSYEVDYGDGSDAVTGVASPVSPGSPGVPSQGFVIADHTYADEGTGTYLVTVGVADDDMGRLGEPPVERTIPVTVRNVAPQLFAFTDTDVTSDGITSVSGMVSDVGLDPITVTIVWGDGATSTQTFRGPGVHSFNFDHQYIGNPDGSNAAADITITTLVDDGDGGTVAGSTLADVPGEGLSPAVIETTLSAAPATIVLAARSEEAVTVSTQTEVTTQAFETPPPVEEEVADDTVRQVVLRIVSPSGEEVVDKTTGKVKEVLLSEADLSDLQRFFANWPFGRYRIYLREGVALRLIIDVQVQDGQLVDPSADGGDLPDEVIETPADIDETPPTDAPPTEAAQPTTEEGAAIHVRQWEAFGATGASDEDAPDSALPASSLALGGLAGLALRNRRARRADRLWAGFTRRPKPKDPQRGVKSPC